MLEVRKCSSCGVDKPLSCYPLRQELSKVMFRKKCKDCMTEDQRDRRQAEKAKPKPVSKAVYSNALPTLIKGASNVTL